MLLLLAAFISCKKDKNESTGGDPLIGTWKMLERVEGGTSTMDDCSALNIFNFNADGTMKAQDWVSDGAGGCKDKTPLAVTIKWEKTGENKYKYIMSAGGQSGTTSFSTQFLENNNKVIITETGNVQVTFLRQ